jgi:hypothetical protein
MQAHVVPTCDIGEMRGMREMREMRGMRGMRENYLTSFFPNSQFPIPYLTSVIFRV